MRDIFYGLFAVLLAAGLFIPAGAKAAKKEKLPVAVAQYHLLDGKWDGTAQRLEEGGALTPFDTRMVCDKVAEGWAIACNIEGESNTAGEPVTFNEAHLIGIDPVSGAGRWFSIASGGTIRERLAEWTDSRTLFARARWDTPDGPAEETITYSFGGKKNLSFRTVITIAEKRVFEMTGTLER
ncbi:MAG: hypothetical protein OEY97_01090 [Nitrospirota bacterium]|nr:hypothetical protein [Nitrospirota bacterium]